MKKTVLVNYQYPQNSPTTDEYRMLINGEEVFIYNGTCANFAAISFEGTIEVVVITTRGIEEVAIRPLNLGIDYKVFGQSIKFTLSEPANLYIEVNNQKLPLLLFANGLETDLVQKEQEDVIYFAGGKVYEVGVLELKENQTLYIEGGAVVKGTIRATNADNLRIMGRGILDHDFKNLKSTKTYFVVVEGSRNVLIQDIILIEPQSWMLVLGDCEDVNVKNIKELGYVSSSDGIDIVGSRNVVIDGCFIVNNDDSIVIKSLDLTQRSHIAKLPWDKDVKNVHIKNCSLYTSETNGGSAMEIGYELRTDHISDIIFENIDILGVHGFGSVFGIHNGDRAVVSNVVYDNCRVEHCFDRFIDFRIQSSPMWNKDIQLGQIKNVTFKNCYLKKHLFNDGYTHSLMGGATPENVIDGVVFDNFMMDDKKATSIDDIWLFNKHTYHLEFK